MQNNNSNSVLDRPTPNQTGDSTSTVVASSNNTSGSSSTNTKKMYHSRNIIIDEIAREHINYVLQNRSNYPTDDSFCKDVADEIIEKVNTYIAMENVCRSKGEKLKPITAITPNIIANCIIAFKHTVLIKFDDTPIQIDKCAIGIFMEKGPKMGTYSVWEQDIVDEIEKYDPEIDAKGVAETIRKLTQKTKQVVPNHEPNLIAVNNGIFDYNTKTLLPFTPDKIFTSKSGVNYNPLATNPTFTNPDGTQWNVEDWMNELSDDAEVVDLMWKIVGMVIRPNVPWNKVIWLYSMTGNNGKGTFCRLLRNVCGELSCTSIKLQDFSNDFMLEPLMSASANIVDESDVGEYLDRCANFKATTTHDPINIDRKFKSSVVFRYHGVHVFCMNCLPRTKDKSESFNRRLLTVPMDKCFTGMENTLIKSTYLYDPAVLEYVLYKVLNMNYNELPVPKRCTELLEDYKESNNPIYAFWKEMRTVFVWDLLPYKFVFDVYKAWYDDNNNGSKNSLGFTSFVTEIKAIIDKDPDWKYTTKDNKICTSTRMSKPEPLIGQYDLQNWMNPIYIGTRKVEKCCPLTRESYRGIYRVKD